MTSSGPYCDKRIGHVNLCFTYLLRSVPEPTITIQSSFELGFNRSFRSASMISTSVFLESERRARSTPLRPAPNITTFI